MSTSPISKSHLVKKSVKSEFLRPFYTRLKEILYICTCILQRVQDIKLDSRTITTVLATSEPSYWDCPVYGRRFPIFEGGLW